MKAGKIQILVTFQGIATQGHYRTSHSTSHPLRDYLSTTSLVNGHPHLSQEFPGKRTGKFLRLPITLFFFSLLNLDQ